MKYQLAPHKLLTIVAIISTAIYVASPVTAQTITPIADVDIQTGLVGHWQFNEGNGITVADSSGNGNTGTLANGPAWIGGKLGDALSFDGIDDTVSVPTNGDTLNNISSLTMSLWAYPKNLPSDFSVLFKKKAGASRFRIAMDNAGRMIFSAGYTSSQGSWTTTKGLTLNEWHHVAVVYAFGDTSSNPTIYIDGTSWDITKTVTPIGTPLADDNVLNIGSNNSGSNTFNGFIDEVRMYNRLLISSEAVGLYQEGWSSISPIPSLSFIVPTSGVIGTLITISGSGFTPTGNTVKFGGGFISGLDSLNGTSLSFTLPSAFAACPGGSGSRAPCLLSGIQVTQGQYQVSVQNLTGTSNSVMFTTTSSSPVPSRAPNIVVIMTDDQDDTGSMSVMTKAQNLLAKQGVTFKNSFVENPICCPSRATFLTGQVSHNNGVLANNNDPDGGYKRLLPTANNTLPVWLKQAGYETAFIGKYVNGYPAGLPLTAIAPGWDTWFQLVTPYQYYGYTINDNGVLRAYGSNAADYQTDVLAKKAEEYISAHASTTKPFFLWLNPVAPHWGDPGGAGPEPAPRHKGMFASVPLPLPPNFNEAEMFDKPSFIRLVPRMDATMLEYASDSFQQRRESLLAVDEMVEDIVDTLARTGGLDNTLIVYTSDNGFFHGEHRLAAGKVLPYEESIRVPLIIRGPGVAPGVVRTELVNNTDLVATIVATAEAVPGRVLDGRSLAPLLGSVGTPWRSAMLFEGVDATPFSSALRDGLYAAIRTSQFLYAEHALATGTVEKEFYDLVADPYELESRSNDPRYGSVVAKLADLLRDLKSCAGASCWITDAEPAVAGERPIPVTTSALPVSNIFGRTKLDPLTLQRIGPQDADETSWASPQLPTVPARDSFSVILRFGMSNSDVTRLQTLLAQDPSLYPEGLVTGYFGTLTRQAVIRFQEKYAGEILQPLGLSRGTGFVGFATLRKLSDLMK